MKITTKEVRETAKILDNLIEEYKKEKPEEKRDWRTYEQRLANRIRTAMKELEPLVEAAIAAIKTIRMEKRGKKQKLSLKQKTLLLLLKHLFIKSNREMSTMLVVFSLLSDIDISYKTVERLYSDPEVIMVLHNLHRLMLIKKGVERANCSGDGTGYSLTVKKHYATEAQKLKDKVKAAKTAKMHSRKKRKKRLKRQFVYSFSLIDLDTRMYIGYGTSSKSEKEAFMKAFEIIPADIDVNSMRLDRYYSGQKYVKLFEEKFSGGRLKMYLIPKKNATIKGTWKWKRMLYDLVNNTQDYLHEYFKRNQSESGISEDKRRFGWMIAQRREDRIDTANFCTTVWHNLFWLEKA